MMSKPKHLLAIHQWVSLIYFPDSKGNLAVHNDNIPGKPWRHTHTHTHKCACFHSTGRWFQMFPKRMNSREAPRRPALDSTKSWKPTSWNHRTPCCFLLIDPSQAQAHIYDLSPQDVSGPWGIQEGWHPYRCIQNPVIRGNPGKE